MAPPNEIKVSDPALVCSSSTPIESGEVLYTPSVVPESSEKNLNVSVGVHDDAAGMSYAQPLTLTRRPTNIFDANPIQVQANQKRVLIALGDALQTWINQEAAQGNPVNPHLEDLAHLLHQGKLPDANDPDFQELINQSFADTGLDAIIHAIALEADQSPNRNLHAQALRFSLQYYCQHNTHSPADNAIRQSLVTALSNSNNTDSRSILAEVARNQNTPANIQQQIQSALSTNATYHATNNGGAANPTPSVGVSPAIQAAYLADTANHAAQAVVIPANTSPDRSTRLSFNMSQHGVMESGAALLGRTLYPSGASVITPLLLSLAPSIQHPELHPSILSSIVHPEGNPVNNSQGPAANIGNLIPGTSLPRNNAPLAPGETVHAITREPVSVETSTAPRFLQFLGLSEANAHNITSSLPSPFVTAFAAMMGGAQHSTVNQINPAASILFASNNYAVSAYSVRPVGASASADSGQEGFGESREGSSQGHSGQGSGGENPHRDNPEQPNPADVYSTNVG